MMKTKRIQKWLAVALGLVMTAGVAACGTNVSGQSQAEPAEQKAATSSKEDTKKEEKGEEVLTADNFNIDDVKPFSIRVGVNSSDDNQYLKILDDHTGFLKDRGIDLVTTEFAAGINTIDAITTGQLDIGNFADYAGINRIA
jgi:NitT/TauT family transport system substrate-binding protein